MELCPTLLFVVEDVDNAFVLSYHPIIVKEGPDHHYFHQRHGFQLIIQRSSASIFSNPASAH